MMSQLVLIVAGATLPPLSSLLQGAIQTQRIGPGTSYPQHARPYQPGQSRRSFMHWTLLAALAVTSTQLGLVSLRFFWPNKTEAFGSEIIAAKKSAVPPADGDPLINREGRFYLLNTSDGLLALYWKCTHLGCTVPWVKEEGQFHCPCHGSIFDRQGRVRAGPAPRPLDMMAIRIEGDSIIVNTGKITQRARYDPGQATMM